MQDSVRYGLGGYWSWEYHRGAPEDCGLGDYKVAILHIQLLLVLGYCSLLYQYYMPLFLSCKG